MLPAPGAGYLNEQSQLLRGIMYRMNHDYDDYDDYDDNYNYHDNRDEEWEDIADYYTPPARPSLWTRLKIFLVGLRWRLRRTPKDLSDIPF